MLASISSSSHIIIRVFIMDRVWTSVNQTRYYPNFKTNQLGTWIPKYRPLRYLQTLWGSIWSPYKKDLYDIHNIIKCIWHVIERVTSNRHARFDDPYLEGMGNGMSIDVSVRPWLVEVGRAKCVAQWNFTNPVENLRHKKGKVGEVFGTKPYK